MVIWNARDGNRVANVWHLIHIRAPTLVHDISRKTRWNQSDYYNETRQHVACFASSRNENVTKCVPPEVSPRDHPRNCRDDVITNHPEVWSSCTTIVLHLRRHSSNSSSQTHPTQRIISARSGAPDCRIKSCRRSECSLFSIRFIRLFECNYVVRSSSSVRDDRRKQSTIIARRRNSPKKIFRVLLFTIESRRSLHRL